MTKEMNNELKELMEEKILSVNQKLDAQTKSINEKMDAQAKSVNEKMDLQHEMIQVQLSAILDKANLKEKRIDEINHTLVGMIGVDAQHYINCVNTKRIADIEKKISENQLELDKRLLAVDFLGKYPKWILLGILGLFCIGYLQLRGVDVTLKSIKPGIEAFEKIQQKSIDEEKQMEKNTDKQTKEILGNKK